MPEFHIAVVAGDGIGPEVTEQAMVQTCNPAHSS